MSLISGAASSHSAEAATILKIGGGFFGPYGAAVDVIGNVFADTDVSAVYEIL